MAWWLMAMMPTRLPLHDQRMDDVGAPEGLPRTGRPLDGHIAVVEIRRPVDDGLDIVGEDTADGTVAGLEPGELPSQQGH